MMYPSQILAGFGLLFLLCGVLSGWWLAADLAASKGVGNRYVWATHKAALWLGFMNLGLSYTSGLLRLNEATLVVAAWLQCTGGVLVLVSQSWLAIKRNPNLWVQKDRLPTAVNVIGDIAITVSTVVYAYGGVISFLISG
jgi:hypothetical protein